MDFLSFKKEQLLVSENTVTLPLLQIQLQILLNKIMKFKPTRVGKLEAYGNGISLVAEPGVLPELCAKLRTPSRRKIKYTCIVMLYQHLCIMLA